jgi:uncharacterized protein (TIGR02271 family)
MMEAQNQRTLTAFFRDRSDAEEATRDLIAAGIAESNVRLVPGAESDNVAATDVDAGRGFWASLGDFFFPAEDRAVYAEGLRRGGYLVTVDAVTQAQHDKAVDILDDEGTIDVDEWADSWRAEGWTANEYTTVERDREPLSPSAAQAASTTEDAFAADRSGDGNVIPVVEEQLRVGKRDVNSGNVRVRSYVVETPVSQTVTLRDDNVSVERRNVDRPLTDGDAAFQDRTIEAEEHREEAVVSKDARVKEEVVLRKTEGQRTETIDDKVRHTKVEVEDGRTGQPQNTQGQRQAGQTQTWNK